MYNIHPAAKLKDRPIKFSEIFPIITPKNAPIPVVKPEIVVIKIAFSLLEPLTFKGRAIEIPSGISWSAIAIASFNPKAFEISPLIVVNGGILYEDNKLVEVDYLKDVKYRDSIVNLNPNI